MRRGGAPRRPRGRRVARGDDSNVRQELAPSHTRCLCPGCPGDRRGGPPAEGARRLPHPHDPALPEPCDGCAVLAVASDGADPTAGVVDDSCPSDPRPGPAGRTGARAAAPPRRRRAAGTGLLVTSVTRTVLDCARRLPVVAGTALVDAALNRSMTTRDALVDMVAVMRRWTGVGLARAAIGRADPATESPGETWCRLVLLDAGVPVRSQVEVCDAAGFVARADFGITGTWVLVEFDGKGKYELSGDPAHAHWQEKLRHDALVSLGYEVVRVTWQELRDRVGLERKVRQAMHRSRQRHPGGEPPGWAIRST